jgi:hypothetical protein
MIWTTAPGGVQFWDDGDIHASVFPLSPNGHAEWSVVCTDGLAVLSYSWGFDFFCEYEECHSGVEVSVEKAKAAAEKAIGIISGMA